MGFRTDVVRRNEWREALAREMPPRDEPVAYNRAITARYARWYLAEPRFKWAAMATFASYQCGQVLALVHDGEAGPIHLGPRGRRAATALLGTTTELVREINACVFDDVGWAHHAFLETRGDADAIAGELVDEPGHRDLVRAFAELEIADELARSDGPGAAAAARFGVWEAMRLILRHEQLSAVQPRFGQIRGAFRARLTLLGMTPFQQLSSEPVRDSWFVAYALRRMATTRRFADLPDMTKFEQRWPWIETEVIPLFREVEERSDPGMRALMERFATLDGGTPPVRRTINAVREARA